MPDIPETMIMKYDNPSGSYCHGATKLKDCNIHNAGGLAFLLCLTLLTTQALSQNIPDQPVLDISRVLTAVSLSPVAVYASIKRNSIEARDIPNLKISQKIANDESVVR